MTINVRLDEALVTQAKIHAEAEHRSVAKQIEYWAKVGQLMIDNPDLSYEFVREAQQANGEVTQGLVTGYVRHSPRQ